MAQSAAEHGWHVGPVRKERQRQRHGDSGDGRGRAAKGAGASCRPAVFPMNRSSRSVDRRPKIEVLTLYRSRDYRQIEFGRACPTCRLLAADIRPSEPNATILDVAVVSTGPSGHWFRCPAGWRCGVPEFSPPDEPHVSGCAGRQVCRVWRLSDDESEARDTVQITYEADQAACRNCPEGVDYPSARKRWEAAMSQAQRACEAFPDRPRTALRDAARPGDPHRMPEKQPPGGATGRTEAGSSGAGREWRS